METEELQRETGKSRIDLRQGDCLELMKEIPDGSVDLVVTSPPYDNLRTYNGKCEWNEAVWEKTFVEIFRLLKNGGVCVWIVNDSTIDGSETGTSFRQALFAKSIGFNLHDTMIWYKNSGFPYPCKVRYNPGFEFMFVFAKGKIQTANLIQDKRNKSAGELVHGRGRQIDGSTKRFSGVGRTQIREFGVRYNVWEIPACQSQTERTGHPAQFPVRLAQDHILTWSNEGETILDPFMGSGSTGVACVNTGRNFIGMELDPGYFEIAKKRIEEAERQ